MPQVGIVMGSDSDLKVMSSAASMLEEFGIEKLRKAQAISLSGGERRRAELARALAASPEFILLDDHTLSLEVVVSSISTPVGNSANSNSPDALTLGTLPASEAVYLESNFIEELNSSASLFVSPVVNPCHILAI